jgi:hypothetical protein
LKDYEEKCLFVSKTIDLESVQNFVPPSVHGQAEVHRICKRNHSRPRK